MSDLISRQAAIETIDEQIEQCNKSLSSFDISLRDGFAIKVERASLVAFREILEYLPPAQLSTNLAEVGTDCISRQAAINAIDECYCGGEDSCGEPWIYQENAVEAIQMIEPIQPAEPNKDKVSNLLYHIYSIQSPHLDMSGVIAKKYYCEELWKELFGKGSELPGWMN